MKRMFFIMILFTSFYSFSQDKIVTVKKTKKGTFYETLYYGARLQPSALISYSSTVTGIIKKVYVKEGDRVTKGTPLVSVARRSSATDYLPSVITSQVSGIVAKMEFVENQEVSEKEEIVVIADISSYKVEFLLSDKDIVRVKKGDSVFIRDKGYKGIISSVSIIPEGTTGLFKSTVDFTPAAGLFSGAFVELEIRVDYYEGVVVPVEWIQNKYGKTMISIVENNKVVFREIATGKRYGKKIAINSGLKPGDEVIIKYNKLIFDGDEVTVKEDENNTDGKATKGQEGSGPGSGRGL